MLAMVALAVMEVLVALEAKPMAVLEELEVLAVTAVQLVTAAVVDLPMEATALVYLMQATLAWQMAVTEEIL